MGFFWISLTACVDSSSTGTLHVKAVFPGSFELYRIIGDSTLQFVSVQEGRYNQDLNLDAGTYLVLADCSHQVVLVSRDRTTNLVTHTIEFETPRPPDPEDVFTIQCSRYEKTQSRQSLNNRFRLTVFGTERDFLVGMKPFKVDLIPFKGGTESKRIKVMLSAIQVSKISNELTQPFYFVSPETEYLAITQRQEFGRWQFFLPGPYRVSVNGTSQQLVLKEGDMVSLSPAVLKVFSQEGVDLSAYASIKGRPYSIETLEQQQFDINQGYPVLPGEIQLLFDGYLKPSRIQVEANSVTNIQMNSVQVKLDCGYWEWECLGKKEVMLYEKGQAYPFLESLSDVPILYMNGIHGEVELSLEDADGLRYQLPSHKKNLILSTSRVILIPTPTYKPAFFTDLVRMEGLHAPFLGASFDIQANRVKTMTLISGDYALAQYLSSRSSEVRTVSKKSLHLQPDSSETLEFEYAVAELKQLAPAKALISKELKRLRHEPYSSLHRISELF